MHSDRDDSSFMSSYAGSKDLYKSRRPAMLGATHYSYEFDGHPPERKDQINFQNIHLFKNTRDP